ncbi:WbqC family protein [Flavobacteriaceae bacterium]|nr:WbqC family protein [Flavobacteriaceae bacterium]
MEAVVTPAYLPSIYYMSWLLRQEKILFNTAANYQKQTARNRASIYGANGKIDLNIPITHTKSEKRKKDADAQIFKDEDWQRQHWKSITSAYKSSPFFEFYEDDLRPFFIQKHTQLMPFNIGLIHTLMTLLGSEIPQEVVFFDPKKHVPMVALILSKKTKNPLLPPYKQVFDNKYGFISNLSCIDLLFNLGPESLDYLQDINHEYLN